MKPNSIEIQFETADKNLKSLFVEKLENEVSVESIELKNEKKFLGAFDTSYLFTFLITIATSASTKVLTDILSDAVKKGMKTLFINKKKIDLKKNLANSLTDLLTPNDDN